MGEDPRRPVPKPAPVRPPSENADEASGDEADNQLRREELAGQPPPKRAPRRAEVPPDRSGELPSERGPNK
jgi:hypothetical protein